MHRHAWLAIAAALFLSIFANPAFADSRVALVIGNGAYTHAPHLPNPSHDAEDVAAALKRTGFETIVGIDLDQSAMQDAAIRFARAARAADVAVFYYSGHAMQYAGVNYLIPVDAQLTDEADLRRMARVDEILADLQLARNLRILVLDSCRDNPLADELKRSIGRTRGISIGRGLARLESPSGTIVSYATQSGATAQDGNGRNSPYTSAFLNHIEDKEEISTVFHRISANVYANTGGEQVPELSLSFFGEYYLNGKVQVTATPALPPADPCATAGDHWRSAEAIGTVDAFQDHLARFPNCTFAGLAKARIEGLKNKVATATSSASKSEPPMAPPPVDLPPPTTDVLDQTLASRIDAATTVDQLETLMASLPNETLKLKAQARVEELKKTQVATLKPAAPPQPEALSTSSPGQSIGGLHYTLPADAELLAKDTSHSVRSIDFSPKGDRIVGWRGDDTVIMWDIATGKLLWSVSDDNGGVGSVAFSPDGTRVASGGHGDAIRIRDAATGAVLRTIEPKDTNIETVVFLPNGEWLAAGDNDDKVELWNTTTGKLIRTMGGRPGCYCYPSIGLSSDGTRIVSGYSDKSIKIWDPASGKMVRSFKVKSGEPMDTAFSPNGAQIVSGQDDKTVKVWEAATGRMLSSFVAHTSRVTSVAFSPDGSRIASASQSGDLGADRLVKLWDTSGKLMMSLQGHHQDVETIRFSPQGSRIASGDFDGAIKLWDVATGALLATFAVTDRHGVAYTPDGLFVTDIDPATALKIVRGGVELPLGELAARNRRDSLADVLKTATK